jgi:hypothetical protein
LEITILDRLIESAPGIFVLRDPKEAMRQKNKISLMKLRFGSVSGNNKLSDFFGQQKKIETDWGEMKASAEDTPRFCIRVTLPTSELPTVKMSTSE